MRVLTTATKNELSSMNPNSANQRWSRWTITVTPPEKKRVQRNFETVRENSARFMRKAFGSATQMQVEEKQDGTYVISVRTEGHPAHDPDYVAFYAQNFLRFYTIGFGVGTQVHTEAKLEAGSKQDGTPAEQLLILPTLHFSLED